MSPVRLAALATAVPGQRYSQAEIQAYLTPWLGRSRYLRPVYARSAIEHRNLVADVDFFAEPRSTQARNERYMEAAVPLGVEVATACLTRAGVAPTEVTDLIVVSCTGIEIPGLDLHLAGRLACAPNLQRLCILGMGCYAAFPGLRAAADIVAARPGRRVLLVAVELCSLHLQRDESLDTIMSTAIFADGAAAVLLDSGPHGGVRLIHQRTQCAYDTFEHMAFKLTDEGFRMSLSAYVPNVLAANIACFVDALLEECGLTRQQVRHWGIHPGGSKILDALQAQLELPPEALTASRQVLRDHGNMSSPTIIFVLESILRDTAPAPGEFAVLLAFGPGLTMEGAVVQF